MNNSKREKFLQLANKRVNKLINDVRLVANLSNKSNYEYTGEDVKKIFKTLEAELKECRSLFEKNGHKEVRTFWLE